jgi:hypothetical protein
MFPNVCPRLLPSADAADRSRILQWSTLPIEVGYAESNLLL